MRVAYGVVLRPDAETSRSLVELSHVVGDGHEPLMLLGDDAPPHVSVLHVEEAADRTADLAAAVARHRGRTFPARIIGLLYSVVPPGDYYVPTGGYYFGLEMIRSPELDAVHREFLSLGHRPLGLVGPDYRPHITLGVTAVPPSLPPLSRVPTGVISLTMAGGAVGPFGTFPNLVE
ncbi:2'-5' RNA ligase family protein [Actinoplanes sp. M2I2]|uniref:2'-5' RNA ligase family protein n=1 Tax=Actinoplanes sp. M2I2 TaxID=1734444 RepID=UPI00201FCB33|nr:2'-5' RNA ligase family protein [Actinoplanes sp. M2I2]